MAASGRRTQSEGETLDLLLVTHFPNSVAIEREATPDAAPVPNIWTGGWLQGLSPMGQWYGQLTHLPQSPGMDGIFPALLQEGQGSLSLTCSRFFMPDWLYSSHMAPG